MGGVERRNTCPKCRALLERGTRFCPYCGTDTRHLDAPSAQADAEATSHFGVWILCLNLAVFAATVVLDPLRAEQPLMSPSGESWILFGSCHMTDRVPSMPETSMAQLVHILRRLTLWFGIDVWPGQGNGNLF